MGMTDTKIKILLSLLDNRLTYNELIEKVGVKRRALLYNIKILEEQGLVARQQLDGRTWLSLTDKGKTYLKEVIPSIWVINTVSSIIFILLIYGFVSIIVIAYAITFNINSIMFSLTVFYPITYLVLSLIFYRFIIYPLKQKLNKINTSIDR